MSKIGSIIQSTRTFFEDVVTELKKCAWPSKSELFDSTIVVIVSVAILGGFVAICDLVLRYLVGWVLG